GVEDAPGNDHALAERRAIAMDRQVLVLIANEALGHVRTRRVEHARRHLEELFLRRAQVRASVVLMPIRRVYVEGTGEVVHRFLRLTEQGPKSFREYSSRPKPRRAFR